MSYSAFAGSDDIRNHYFPAYEREKSCWLVEKSLAIQGNAQLFSHFCLFNILGNLRLITVLFFAKLLTIAASLSVTLWSFSVAENFVNHSILCHKASFKATRCVHNRILLYTKQSFRLTDTKSWLETLFSYMGNTNIRQSGSHYRKRIDARRGVQLAQCAVSVHSVLIRMRPHQSLKNHHVIIRQFMIHCLVLHKCTHIFCFHQIL